MRKFGKLGYGCVAALAALAWLAGGARAGEGAIAPAEGATVEVLKHEHLAFLDLPRAERERVFAEKEYRKGMTKVGCAPRKVEFAWPAVEGATGYELQVSPSPDFSAPLATASVAEPKAQLRNFRIATKYYWRVVAKTPEGEKTGPVHTFLTADRAPRWVLVQGVPNVRDLGGRVGLNGRRVRQDLVFRSAGLNGNAKPVKCTEEEMLARNPGLAKEKAALEKRIETFNKEVRHGGAAPAPYPLGGAWTAFFPEKDTLTAQEIAEAAALTAIPGELFGAKGKKVEADAKGECVFPLVKERKPVVLMQEFDAPKAWLVLATVGGDWFWLLAINGETLCDRTEAGNLVPPAKGNHPQLLPLREGKNVATVVLLSGSAGWKWCMGPLPVPPQGDANRKAALKGVIRGMEALVKDRADGVKGYAPGSVRLSPEMKKYMLETMKIKSDIDLRTDNECAGMTGSPLGDTVKWYHVSSAAYGGMGRESGRLAFAKVFRLFLDRDNYPLVFHCIGGADRTGAVAFILNGILGVDEEELRRDWEMTGFSWDGLEFSHKSRGFEDLVNVFRQYPGDTLCEQICGYVRSLGFTQADIDQFRETMLEPVAK